VSVEATIANLYRQEAGRMTAALFSYFGPTAMAQAEDLVQDTFISALQTWKTSGLPDHPKAWLYRVCKNKALNEVKRKKELRLAEDTPNAHLQELAVERLEQVFLDHELRDSQLRLLFACCHASLSPKAQLILTLKLVSGFKTAEIARCLAMKEEAVEKGLQRSRIRLQGPETRLDVPFLQRAAQRLPVVQLVLYLMYTEGYSASRGEEQIKKELCLEAMRLCNALLEIPSLQPNTTHALLALMLLHTARFGARATAGGTIIELEMQDRSLWDKDLIQLGIRHLNKAKEGPQKHRFLLEAAIAAQHCLAPTFAATNWPLIYALYQQLEALHPSPFVHLNAGIALLYAQGPLKALPLLQELEKHVFLGRHHLLQLALAKAWLLLGEAPQAASCYQKALAATSVEAEKVFIQQKISEVGTA
jgi:RNA polymerase sigma-70 factor, ECF subfamily